jgi:hypothetical protein
LFAAAVSVFVLAVVGTALSVERGSSSGPSRVTAHQVVADHDGIASVRPLADRSVLDLRQVHSRLLLLAWVGVLLAAALLAHTSGRAVELRTLRSGSVVATRQRYDRGPPAAAFV